MAQTPAPEHATPQRLVIEDSVLVEAPIQEVYQQWGDLNHFPDFMRNIISVTPIGSDRYHWIASFFGERQEWDAEITAREDQRHVAWRSLGEFSRRSSLRTWLYKIATNRCLTMLRADGRRPRRAAPLPEARMPEPTGAGDAPPWLEPYPDVLLNGLADQAPGPEARYGSSEAISLAFITGLQLLPPRQRAALLLRDVLGYQANEVAGMLDTTRESLHSALRRARAAQLARGYSIETRRNRSSASSVRRTTRSASAA